MRGGSVTLLVAAAVVAVLYQLCVHCLDRHIARTMGGLGRDALPPWFDRRLQPLLREKWRERHNRTVNRFMTAVSLVRRCERGSTRWDALARKIDRIAVRDRPDLVVGIKTGGAFIANRVAARWADDPPEVEYMRVSKYGGRGPLERMAIWTRFLLLPEAARAALDNRTAVVKEIPAAGVIRGKAVLLVDDQVGTGSTLRTARRALLKRGATRVQTFVLGCTSAHGRRFIDYGGRHGYIHRWPWGCDS